jgi:hypothetical protein
MDDMKDKSIHFTAQKLTEEIQNMTVYKKFYSQIQVSLRFMLIIISLFNNVISKTVALSGKMIVEQGK